MKNDRKVVYIGFIETRFPDGSKIKLEDAKYYSEYDGYGVEKDEVLYLISQEEL